MAEQNDGNSSFTQEQLDAVVKVATEKALEDYKKTNSKDDTNNKDALDKAREIKAKEEEVARNTESLTKAIKFNMEIDDFIHKKMGFLPKTAVKVAELVKNQKYDGEVYRANDLRKLLLKDFFDVKENVDVLPTDELKERVNTFKSLTEDAKAEGSGEFFELLKIAINQHEMIAKAADVKKANDGLNTDDTSSGNTKKYYELAAKRFYGKDAE